MSTNTSSSMPYAEQASDFERFKSFLPKQYQDVTPQEFAQAHALNGNNDYQEFGKGDYNPVRTGLATANENINNSAFGQTLGSVGSKVYGAFGADPEKGRQFGQQGAAQLASIGVPGLIGAGVASLAGPELAPAGAYIGTGGGALLSGLSKYGESGSKRAAAESAAMVPLMGGVAGMGEKAGLGWAAQAAQKLNLDPANPFVNALGTITGFGAGQGAIALGGEAQHQLGEVMAGHGLDTNRGPGELAAEQVMNILPFSPLLASHLPSMSREFAKTALQQEEATKASNDTQASNPSTNMADKTDIRGSASAMDIAVPPEERLKVLDEKVGVNSPINILPPNLNVIIAHDGETVEKSDPTVSQRTDVKTLAAGQEFLGAPILSEGEPSVESMKGGLITPHGSPEEFFALKDNNARLARQVAVQTGEAVEPLLVKVQGAEDARKAGDPMPWQQLRVELSTKLSEAQKATEAPPSHEESLQAAQNAVNILQELATRPISTKGTEIVQHLQDTNTGIVSLKDILQGLLVHDGPGGWDSSSIQHFTQDNVTQLLSWMKDQGMEDPNHLFDRLGEAVKSKAHDASIHAMNLIRELNQAFAAQKDVTEAIDKENVKALKQARADDPHAHLSDEEFKNHILQGDEPSWVEEVDESRPDANRDLAQYDTKGNTVRRYAMRMADKAMERVPEGERGTDKWEKQFKGVYRNKLNQGKMAAERLRTRSGENLSQGSAEYSKEEQTENNQAKEIGEKQVEDFHSQIDKDLGLGEPLKLDDKELSNPQLVAKKVGLIIRDTLTKWISDFGSFQAMVRSKDVTARMKALGVNIPHFNTHEGQAFLLAIKYEQQGINARGKQKEAPGQPAVSKEVQANIKNFHDELIAATIRIGKPMQDLRNVTGRRIAAFERLDALIKDSLARSPDLPDGFKYRLGDISHAELGGGKELTPIRVPDAALEEPTTAGKTLAVLGEMAKQFGKAIGWSDAEAHTFKDFLQRMMAHLPIDFLKNTNLRELVGGADTLLGVTQGRMGASQINAIGVRMSHGDALKFESALAHELTHGMINRAESIAAGYNKGSSIAQDIAARMVALKNFTDAMTPIEKQALLAEHLQAMYPEATAEFIHQLVVRGGTVDGEFLPIYFQGTLHALMSGDAKVGNFYKESPSVFRGAIRAVSSFIQHAFQVLRDFYNKSGLFGHDGEFPLSGVKAKIDEAVKGIINGERAVQAAMAQAHVVESRLSPEALMETYRDNPIVVTGDLNSEMQALSFKDMKDFGDSVIEKLFSPFGWISSNFDGFQQLANSNRSLLQIARQVRMYRTIAHDGLVRSSMHFPTRYKDGKMVEDTGLSWVSDINGSKTLGGPDGHLSDLLRWQNENESEEHLGEEAWLNSPEKIQSGGWTKGATLSPRDRDLLATASNHLVLMHRNLAKQRIESLYVDLQTNLGHMLISDATVGPEIKDFNSVMALTDKIVELSKAKLDPSKASLVPLLEQQLRGVIGEKPPQSIGNMLKVADTIVPKIGGIAVKLLGPTLQGKGAYTPETRPGQFLVRYTTNDGKTQVSGAQGFESKSAAEKAAKSMREEGKLNVQVQDKGMFRQNQVSPSQLDMISQHEEAAFQELQKIMSPEEFEKVQSVFQPLRATREAMTKGLEANLMQRKLAPGRETLDMLQNSINSGSNSVFLIAQKIVASRSGIALRDPLLKSDADLWQRATDQVKNTLYHPKNWSAFNKATNLYYCGYNLSTTFVELMQGAQLVPAFFTERGSGILESFGHLGAGYKFAIDHASGVYNKSEEQLARMQQTMSAKDWREYTRNKVLSEMAAKMGLTVASKIGTLADERSFRIANLKNVLDGKRPLESIQSMGTNAGRMLVRGAEKFHDISQYVNNLHSLGASISFLDKHPEQAGKRSKSQLTHEDYLNWAEQVKASTQSAGGPGDTPGIMTNSGKFWPVLSSMRVLQGYATSMIGTTARLFKESINENYGTGVERGQAMKALGTLVATQVALSGVFGIQPTAALVGITQAILGKDYDLQTMMRETFMKIFGEEEDTGSFLTDVAMKGLPTTLSPVDVSGRLGMGQIFGVDASGDMRLSNILGAGSSMVDQVYSNLRSAGEDLAQGNPTAALEHTGRAMPNALRNKWGALFDDGNVRGTDGKIVGQLSDTEKGLVALGFQPNSISNSRDLERGAKAAENLKRDSLKQLYNQAANLVGSGDSGGAQQLLQEYARTNPGFDIKEGIRGVVQAIQNRNVPQNPLNALGKQSAPQAHELARAYGTPPQQSEVERLKKQDQLVQTLGIQGIPPTSAQQFFKAQRMDNMLQANPGMTKAEAWDRIRQQHGSEAPMLQ